MCRTQKHTIILQIPALCRLSLFKPADRVHCRQQMVLLTHLCPSKVTNRPKRQIRITGSAINAPATDWCGVGPQLRQLGLLVLLFQIWLRQLQRQLAAEHDGQ